MAESKELYLGKYEIRETEAPYGMVLNTEVRTVELVYAGQEVEVTETAASFYNERQKVSVSLNKVLEPDETFGIGMNGEITAVTFALYAAEDLTAADGSVIPADGMIEILSVDAEGFGYCGTDLPIGSYYLQELSTDSHYILSDTKYPVVFEYARQDAALVQIIANDGEDIGNDLMYGEVHGLKKDDSGNPLGGALIGLFKVDCTEFTTENALMTATSAEDGSFSFAQVPYGNWIVREIEAPTGYVLSEELYDVTIGEDGAVVEVEIENTLIRGTVQLTKVDKGFFSTFFDFRADLKTEDFKTEFDEVINALRFDENYGGALKDRTSLAAYCRRSQESSFGGDGRKFGFRADTEQYSYLLCLNPNRGEYKLYCYCYQRKWLDHHLQQAEKGIRFIDPHYKELFRIPDGDQIRITYADGEKRDSVCRYIDDYHVEIGSVRSNLLHICQFAEMMERNGGTVIPLRSSLPEQCYGVLPDTGELIIIKKGESGYYRTDVAATSKEETHALADEYNGKLGVSACGE